MLSALVAKPKPDKLEAGQLWMRAFNIGPIYYYVYHGGTDDFKILCFNEISIAFESAMNNANPQELLSHASFVFLGTINIAKILNDIAKTKG